jgi:hypothetical protein
LLSCSPKNLLDFLEKTSHRRDAERAKKGKMYFLQKVGLFSADNNLCVLCVSAVKISFCSAVKFVSKEYKMAKNTKRTVTISASAPSNRSEFNPDYSDVKKDLKRIGSLAGFFVLVLIVISFFLK